MIFPSQLSVHLWSQYVIVFPLTAVAILAWLSPQKNGYPALKALGTPTCDFQPSWVRQVFKFLVFGIEPFSSSPTHFFKLNPPAIKHWLTKFEQSQPKSL